MKRVSSAWLEGLKGDEKEQMREYVLGSEKLLDKLTEILYNMQERSETTVLDDYDSPSWSHRQAHLNGQGDVIRKLLEIVTLKEREDYPKHMI